MQLKDAARHFGSVGLLFPLLLIFLTVADSAFACPGHKNGVALRARAINTQTASRMAPTVIRYKAPASYRRCGNNLYDTRGAKYVAIRGNGNHSGSAARYVAVRNSDGYKMSRKRYIAVRDVDLDAPRYVAVRRHTAYVDTGTRYIAVRNNAPRTRYVAVRDIDIDDDDEPRYVAVRRIAPRTKYVAVRNIDIDDDDAPEYVPVRNVRNGCARVVALRSCPDQIETTSVRHDVLRNDNEYSTGAKYVALKDESDDDSYIVQNVSDDVEHVDLQSGTNYVEYAPVSNYNGDVETYTPANEAVSTKTISYDPSAYDNDDDQAFLDGGGATYVAAGDIEDACLRQVAIGVAPVAPSTRAVSYVPVEQVDDDASFTGSDTTYIATDDAAPTIRFVALTEADDDVGAGTVSYVPVDDVEETDAETITYVPVNDIEDTNAETVSYVPVNDIEDTNAEIVSYVPVDDVDTTDIAAEACPMLVSSVDTEPLYVTDAPPVLAEEVDADLVADLRGTQQIAGEFGYRDGFEDGKDAALEGDVYHPENSGDYKKATEGYEDTFGDKDVYKDGYRTSYLQGYGAGFESADSSA